MTWALLIAFNCRQFRYLRWLAYAYAAVTVFGTLGTGEHYFIDLVVACPFTVAMQALCTHSLPMKSPERLVPLLGGTAVTLVWLVLLSYCTRMFFMGNPVVPWACIVGSTGLAAVWMKQLLSVKQSEPQGTAGMVRAAAVGA